MPEAETCGRKRARSPNTSEIERWALQYAKDPLRAIEEVEAIECMATDCSGAGQPMQVAIAGREIIERGEVFQVAAVAAQQDFPQIDQAVDAPFEGCNFAGLVTVPMHHLAVVLEEGDVIGRGFQAKVKAAVRRDSRPDGFATAMKRWETIVSRAGLAARCADRSGRR